MGAVVTPSSSSSIDPVPVSSPVPSSSIHPSLPQEQTTQTQLLPQHCHHHHQESNFLPQNSLPEKHTKHSFVFALHATRLLPRPCSPAAPQNSSLVSRHLPISPTRTTAVESECPFFGFALRIHLLIRRRVPPPTTTTLTCFYCIGFAHSQLCYSQRTVSELYNSLPFNIFHLIRTTMAGIETPQPLGRGCGVVWNSSPTKESQQPALRLTCNHFLIRFFTPNHPRNLTSSSSSSLTDTGTQTLRGRGRVWSLAVRTINLPHLHPHPPGGCGILTAAMDNQLWLSSHNAEYLLWVEWLIAAIKNEEEVEGRKLNKENVYEAVFTIHCNENAIFRLRPFSFLSGGADEAGPPRPATTGHWILSMSCPILLSWCRCWWARSQPTIGEDEWRLRRGAADVEKVDFVQCGGCCLKIPGKGNSLAG